MTVLSHSLVSSGQQEIIFVHKFEGYIQQQTEYTHMFIILCLTENGVTNKRTNIKAKPTVFCFFFQHIYLPVNNFKCLSTQHENRCNNLAWLIFACKFGLMFGIIILAPERFLSQWSLLGTWVRSSVSQWGEKLPVTTSYLNGSQPCERYVFWDLRK